LKRLKKKKIERELSRTTEPNGTAYAASESRIFSLFENA
jgi:hypothetical protein